MWIRDEEPDVYRASASLPPVAGYLVGWLTGAGFQDHANASSSLAYDVRRRDWSELLIEAAGLGFLGLGVLALYLFRTRT